MRVDMDNLSLNVHELHDVTHCFVEAICKLGGKKRAKLVHGLHMLVLLLREGSARCNRGCPCTLC